MELFLYAYIFVLGAILGSFYNVVGMRVPVGESIVKPRSHCPNCKHILRWTELIPVLSFLSQKGQCRNCKQKISPTYLFFECLTAILFVLSALAIGWSVELFVALSLVSLLIIITISDFRTMLIPDAVLIFFLVIFISLRIFSPLTPWWDSILGAMVGFTLLLLLAIVSKGGMGGGDIKLFGVLGIVLGTTGVLLTLFFASLVGAIVGLIGMVSGKTKRGNPIPFGPFISVAALFSYFFHSSIIEWYFSLF
ncbi:leader peptidase (prepilin peptidase)/N-methyltransferase [Natronobacillus azotifigens]|uniref:Prepilin peptidase n=1 Tax=Natronobacillus azotifigens TaxID=472978 RepID=A0A9J6RA42_9BACI|nr:A24 family peptidase [Natronobacillus azotifigens]MCZ0702407.1 prepilin peptidase [Natronobacillus azotifigens]